VVFTKVWAITPLAGVIYIKCASGGLN